jgi:hypothetical protein
MQCAETGNAISDVYYQCETCKTTWGVIGFSTSSQTNGANCACGGNIEYFNLKVPDTGPARINLPNRQVPSYHPGSSSKVNDNVWLAVIALGAFATVTIGSIATLIFFANTKRNHLQWITVLISIGGMALWYPGNGEVFLGFSHNTGLSLMMLNLMGLVFAVIVMVKHASGSTEAQSKSSFGFPAGHFETLEVDSELKDEELIQLVKTAVNDCEFLIEKDGEDTFPFHAKANVSGTSWGEKIIINLDGREITARSECAFFAQCFDWGKNKENVVRLLESLEKKIKTSVV